jgi:hypothetical protein
MANASGGHHQKEEDRYSYNLAVDRFVSFIKNRFDGTSESFAWESEGLAE